MSRIAFDYAEERQTFGKPLADHQSIAFKLAQMSARTEAARLLVYRSAWLLDQGQAAIRESSTAKLVAAENAWQTVDDAMQIFGGNGYIRGEYMIDRLWRDVRVTRVYDGSSEVQQIIIAQGGCGELRGWGDEEMPDTITGCCRHADVGGRGPRGFTGPPGCQGTCVSEREPAIIVTDRGRHRYRNRGQCHELRP